MLIIKKHIIRSLFASLFFVVVFTVVIQQVFAGPNVKWDIEESVTFTDGPSDMAIDVNRNIYTLYDGLLEKRDSAGVFLWSVNVNSVTTKYKSIAVDATGIYIVGTFDPNPWTDGSQWIMQKRDLSTGSTAGGWTQTAFGAVGASSIDAKALSVAVFGTSIYVGGYSSFLAIVGTSAIQKRSAVTGAFEATILGWDDSSAFSRMWTYDIAIDSTGIYAVGSSRYSDTWDVIKIDFTGNRLWGQTESPASTNGFPLGNGLNSIPFGIAIDGTAVYIVGEEEITTGVFRWRIEKRDLVTGVLDASFGTGGVVYRDNGESFYNRASDVTLHDTGLYVVGTGARDITMPLSRRAFWVMEKFDQNLGTLIWTTGEYQSGTDYSLSRLSNAERKVAIVSDDTGVYTTGYDFDTATILTRTTEKRASHTLTTTLTGIGSGVITSVPVAINCTTGICTQDFIDGTSFVLNANSNVGSTFTGWLGSCTGVGVCAITMNNAKNVTANFALIASDTTPDQFTFIDQTNVALSSAITSIPALVVSGIDAPSTISIIGGMYQINGGAWVSGAGTITNAQTFAVRHTSANSPATAVNTVLTIGGVISDTFTSTTVTPIPPPPSPGNVDGWAWSSNIGWISFSNTTDGSLIPYGVDVSPNTGIGSFSGYALYGAGTGNGWIDFAPSGPYPPIGPAHSAKLDWGTNKVTGWARACAGYANPTACSGATSATGWDGWISFSGTGPTYGVSFDPVTNKLTGFAWGSSVIGWIDFSPSIGSGVVIGGIPPVGNTPPLAQITGPASATVTKFTDSTQTATQSFVGTGTDDSTIPSSLNYEWLSAGCAISESTSSSFTETYVGNGTYTMCLKVQDDDIVPLWSINDPSRTIILKFAECSDGIDNDGDGDIDGADVGCVDGFGNDESASPPIPQCSNNLDDDGDGLFDFDGDNGSGPNPALIDPSCAGNPNGTDESAIPIITSCFGGLADGICQIESGETILNCPADCFRIREI